MRKSRIISIAAINTNPARLARGGGKVRWSSGFMCGSSG